MVEPEAVHSVSLSASSSRLEGLNEAIHMFASPEEADPLKARLLQPRFNLAKGVGRTAVGTDKHVYGKNGALLRLCTVHIHDVVPNYHSASGNQGTKNLLVKVKVLYGVVLVDDGGDKHQIMSRGQVITIEVTGYKRHPCQQALM